MRSALALLLVAIPGAALAHGAPPVRFTAPIGPGNVVVRGEPYPVGWQDPDLYPDHRLTLFVRGTPPPPYEPAWPVQDLEGLAAGSTTVADPANRLVLDTSALAAGSWFPWFSIVEPTGETQYVAPAGVLTVVESGQEPLPSIWFDEPASAVETGDGSFNVTYRTSPADGVTVTLLGSINDLDGEHLTARAEGLPGGTEVIWPLDIRCEEAGAFGIFAVVRDGRGREGSAFAPARVTWRAEAADRTGCGGTGGTSGGGEAPPQGDGGCACTGSPGGEVALAGGALLLLGFARRGRRSQLR